jgi:hypothetical protein
MTMNRPICRHCRRSAVNRPRGLCWHCYYTPGVKDLYGYVECRQSARGVGNGCINATLGEPTQAMPGTREKLEVLAARARNHQALFHPADAGFPPPVQGA